MVRDKIHVRDVSEIAREIRVLFGLGAQVLERSVGTRKRLARHFFAKLKVQTFKKKRIVIQNEDRGGVVKRGHDTFKPWPAECTFRKDLSYYAFVSDPVRRRLKV